MQNVQCGRGPVDYAYLRRMAAGGRLLNSLHFGWDRGIESQSVGIYGIGLVATSAVREASVRVPI
jgi:hypothetical protein